MDLSELFATIVQWLNRKTLFHGFYPYRVQSQTGGRVNLQVVGSTEGLPDVLQVDKAHGLAGAAETCAPASIVLVGFQGGSPGAPFVAFYLDTKPTSITFDAQTLIALGAGATSALALAPALQTWAGLMTAYAHALDAQIVALGRPTSGAAPTLGADVAAVLAKGK